MIAKDFEIRQISIELVKNAPQEENARQKYWGDLKDFVKRHGVPGMPTISEMATLIWKQRHGEVLL